MARIRDLRIDNILDVDVNDTNYTLFSQTFRSQVFTPWKKYMDTEQVYYIMMQVCAMALIWELEKLSH